jgi:phage-related protein
MPRQSAQDKQFNFPGFAKSIASPVVKTATAVVKRGEKVVGNVVGMGKRATSGTWSGTSRLVTNFSKGSVKVASDVGSLATRTVKDTVSGTSKVASGLMKDTTKIARDTLGLKKAKKVKRTPPKTRK